MKLTIGERFALLGLLPAEGNLVTLRIIRDLRKNLGFTETEIKSWKIANRLQSDGRALVTWDSDFSGITKEVPIGDVAKAIIVENLNKLEEQKKLRLELLDLYDKFVDGKGNT